MLELALSCRVLHVLGTWYSVPHPHPRFLARIIWTCSQYQIKYFSNSSAPDAFLHSSIHIARPLLEPLNIVQSIEDDLLTCPFLVVRTQPPNNTITLQERHNPHFTHSNGQRPHSIQRIADPLRDALVASQDIPLSRSLDSLATRGSFAWHNMSNVDDGRNARDTSHKTSTLLSLLSNHLVLQHTAPNLTARDRLALGATNSDFRHLIRQSPGVFRHLDLSAVKTAQFDLAPIDVGGEVWRNVQVDENVTEDEYVTIPLPLLYLTRTGDPC